MDKNDFGIYRPRLTVPEMPPWRSSGSRFPSSQPRLSRLPLIRAGNFEIPSLEDRTSMEFGLAGTGLYSLEIRFHCEDPDDENDRLALSFESGTLGRGILRDEPGNLHTWFPPDHSLDPEHSYGFYFWVDDGMLELIGEGGKLRVVLERENQVRTIDTAEEFEPPNLEVVTLPRMVGRMHLCTPAPIQVEAFPTNSPTGEVRTMLDTEVLQYRAQVDFPLIQGRMSPCEFKAEFHVPEWCGNLNWDIGGFLLTNGMWIQARNVSASGWYDFLVSPHIKFSYDVGNGVRRSVPLEEDWDAFREHGQLFDLEESREVEVNTCLYLAGGEVPPDYYVAELEEINLSSVPDEGDGTFWLQFNNISTLLWSEDPSNGENPFADPTPILRERLQFLNKSIPFPNPGEGEGSIRPHLPLFVLPAAELEGKQSLAIAANPHYFHEMSTWEEAVYIFNHTEAVDVIIALATEDLELLVEAIARWIVEASKENNPDLFCQFGVGTFDTDSNRGWAIRNSPERFMVEGGSAENCTNNQEVSGTDGANVATVSELSPDQDSSRTYNSTIRVRKVPGIFVSGARIQVNSVRTNRDFNGHIRVGVGILGHEGGRDSIPDVAHRLESAARYTPYSYWASGIAPRGPFEFSSGETNEIDFDTIDFSVASADDVDGLYEQLRLTFGSWAGMCLEISLIEIDEADGRVSHRYEDTAFWTVYPYDLLYDAESGRLKEDVERDGDWLILRGTLEPHGSVLDEIGLEIQLKVQAREVYPFEDIDFEALIELFKAYVTKVIMESMRSLWSTNQES